jgi:hypothetical protein
MTNIFRKIIASNDTRISRFHDENDAFMGWREFKNLPLNTIYILRSKVLRSRPDLPWWPFPAKEAIESLIQREWNVIEFGSGSSTIWLARRAGYVYSIEDNPEWHEKIGERLTLQNVTNVTLRLRQHGAFYDLREFVDRTFDLAIVDGYCRFGCIEAVLPKLKPRGFLYLDNSDADKDALLNAPGEEKKAQGLLLRCLQDNPAASLQRFNGLIIGELHSAEGMLLKLAGGSSQHFPIKHSRREQDNFGIHPREIHRAVDRFGS